MEFNAIPHFFIIVYERNQGEFEAGVLRKIYGKTWKILQFSSPPTVY
jgi:hypothetical protein